MESRRKPFSSIEKEILLQIVNKYINIIENKRTDGGSIRMKNDAWNKIMLEFNHSSTVTQKSNTKHLKKCWLNMKAKARDAKTLENQMKLTGGGPAPPDVNSFDSQVLSTLPVVLPTVANSLDGDTIELTADFSDEDDDSEFWLPKAKRQQKDVQENDNISVTLDEAIAAQPVQTASLGEKSNYKKEVNMPQSNLTPHRPTSNKVPDFNGLKIQLLQEQLEYNKEKHKMDLQHLRKMNDMEEKFLEEKYRLELELLQNKLK